MTTTEEADVPFHEDTWLRLHLGSLAAAGVVLGFLNRNQWFFFDEWDFILKRGKTPSLGLFTPHNEHWSTVPALIYKALLLTVGLDEYWPYVAVLVLLHLALAHFLWRASVRAGASPAIATGVAAVFAVLGAGGENITWAFQMGFIGSVTFGWLAVLLHDHDGPFGRRDLAGWAALITGLMCSGPAVTFIGVTTLTAALRRRPWRDTALVAAGPALVYLTWWLVAGRHNNGQLSRGLSDPWQFFDWTWVGITGTADKVVGIPDSGALVILAMVVWWLRHPGAASGRSSIALAGFVGAFAFFVVTGSARADAGVQFVTIGRYVYVAAALLAPATALLLSRVSAATAGTRLVVVGLCAAVAVHNVDLLRIQLKDETAKEREVQRRMASYDAFLEDDPRILSGQRIYIPHGGIEITSELLPRLADYGWDPGIRLTTSEQLHPRLMWQVGMQPANGELDDVRLSITGAAPTSTASEGCVRVRPDDGEEAELVFADGAPSWRVRITSDGPAIVGAAFESPDGGRATRALPLVGDKPQDLVSYVDDLPLVVTIYEGQSVTICGVSVGDTRP